MVYGWLQRRFKGMFWEVVLFAIGEKRRPAGAGRLNIPLAKRPAVKLALLEDSSAPFAGRIERFPPAAGMRPFCYRSGPPTRLVAGRYGTSNHGSAHQRVSVAFPMRTEFPLVRKQGPSAKDSPAPAWLQHVAPRSTGPA